MSGSKRTITLTLSLGTLALAVAAIGVVVGIALAEPPAKEVARKPSTYAPAKDLENQVVELLKRIDKALQDPDDYDESQADKVEKDANTLAVLALVLGKHDTDNRLKPAAAAVMKAALLLADKTNTHADAKAAYTGLLDAGKTRRGGHSELPWRNVADIEQLMLQVPLLNTRLRGIVRTKRFKKSKDKAASLAATLAAVAQVSMFDDTYCTSNSDKAKWVEYSVRMRDACGSIHAAIRADDQGAAKSALEPLVKSCDDCHEYFRVE